MIGNTKFLCQVSDNSFEWNHRNTLLTAHWQKTIQNWKCSTLIKWLYNYLLSRLVKDDKTKTILLKCFYTLINTHQVERFFLSFIVHLVFVLKSTRFLPMNQREVIHTSSTPWTFRFEPLAFQRADSILSWNDGAISLFITSINFYILI